MRNTVIAFLRGVIAFLRGVYEFRHSVTWADPARGNDGLTPLDEAYDWGREWAHRLTLRRFET